MKFKNFKAKLSLLLAVIMLFSLNTVAFAAETSDSSSEFGDILYADNGITVFYGNPEENKELAEEIEEKATRSLQYDNIWVDAHTSVVRYAYITASSSNPITYFTVRQEATSPVEYSQVVVTRPNNDGICYGATWSGLKNNKVSDLVISTSVLWDEPFGGNVYTHTSGTLTLKWNITTGDSGARMNLWAW